MDFSFLIVLLFFCAFLLVLRVFWRKKKSLPVSVNIFPSRKCNYSCGFCFHTAKTEDLTSLDDARQALRLLAAAGMKKLNIAGGEPFLHPKWLAEIVRFAKEELHLESVSIITNGSLVKRKWLEQHGKFVDILGLSIDSFNEETNIKIGRGNGKHLKKSTMIARMTKELGIILKINTVVNRLNHLEDMNEHIASLAPTRWKCFQVLLLEGENSGKGEDLRDATKFLISDEEFKGFLDRHRQQPCLVPESNELMQDSYLLVDEEWRFLNCTGGIKRPGRSILKVGVETALSDAGWDDSKFYERGGFFNWTRPAVGAAPCDGDIGDIEDS
jgi:radical S-adenosyl methionine domain-containing protein 2